MLWRQKLQSPLFTPITRTGNDDKRGFLKGGRRVRNPFLDILTFSCQINVKKIKLEIRELITVQ